MAVGQSGTYRCDAEKDSGLVLPVQTALNGVIGNGDYDKVLNRWGEGWNAFHNLKSTRPV